MDNIELLKQLEEQLLQIQEQNAKKDQIESYINATYESNMEAFSKYYPEIYKQFKRYKVKRNFDYVAIGDVLDIQFQDSDTPFFKGYDPIELNNHNIKKALDTLPIIRSFLGKEEIDFFGQIVYRYRNEIYRKQNADGSNFDKSYPISSLKSVPFVLLVGSALSYPIESIYSQIEVKNLLVIEPSLDIFYASLHIFNYAPLFDFLHSQNLNLDFALGITKDDCIDYLVEYFKDRGGYLSGCMALLSSNYDPAYKDIAEEIDSKFDFFKSNLGFYDDLLFGYSHGINLLLKKKQWVDKSKHLGSKFKSIPIFIVGNGPSLDKDIDFIRKNQDKALIVACGTAIDTLFNIGVQTDFYVATERIDYIEDSISIFKDNHYLDDVILIATNVVHPNVAAYFNKTLIYIKEDEQFDRLFTNSSKYKNSFLNSKKIKCANPLVSNLALSSMLELGFDNIYFLGVDNGKRTGADNHSKASRIYNEYKATNNSEGYNFHEEAKANFGGVVETGYYYQLSIYILENIIHYHRMHNRRLNIINCSDGAYVNGTTPMHSYDIKMNTKDLNKEQVKQDIINIMTFVPQIDEDELLNVIDKDKFYTLVDRLLNALEFKAKTRFEYVNYIYSMNNIISAYEKEASDNFIYSFFIRGTMQQFFMDIQTTLYSYIDEQVGIERADNVKESVKYFLLDAKALFEFMPYYIQGTHRKLLHQKVGFDHEHSKAIDAPTIDRLIEDQSVVKYDEKFVKRYS